MSFEAKRIEAERLEKYKAIQRTRLSLGSQVQAHVMNIISLIEDSTDPGEIADLQAELQLVIDEMGAVQALIPAS